MTGLRLAVALALTLLAFGPALAARPPLLVIAHRGASAERPEHTASAYVRAIEEGADFIEPDLVATKDGVLIVRHENEISATTDVAAHPEFAARRTTKTIDGQTLTGWFTEDFTLAEIRTLKARERLPQLRPANTAFDGHDGVQTFEEAIDLAAREGARRGRPVGVYAELKHPTYFARAGLALEPRFIAVLTSKGLDRRASPVVLQCFEPGALRAVRARLPIRTTLLIDESGAPADFVASGDPRTYADLITPRGLREVTAYADGIGPAKTLILPRDGDGRSTVPTVLVANAHAAGLIVHPWTFRPENVFLPLELRRGNPADPGGAGDLRAEIQRFYDLGVDGVFTDAPALGAAVRDAR